MNELKEKIFDNVAFKLRMQLEKADINPGDEFEFHAYVYSTIGEPDDDDKNPSDHQPSNRYRAEDPLTATTETTMEPRIRLTCSQCGSTDVGRDAWAAWLEWEQEYAVRSVFDQGYCFNCEGETKINEEIVNG